MLAFRRQTVHLRPRQWLIDDLEHQEADRASANSLSAFTRAITRPLREGPNSGRCRYSQRVERFIVVECGLGAASETRTVSADPTGGMEASEKRRRIRHIFGWHALRRGRVSALRNRLTRKIDRRARNGASDRLLFDILRIALQSRRPRSLCYWGIAIERLGRCGSNDTWVRSFSHRSHSRRIFS